MHTSHEVTLHVISHLLFDEDSLGGSNSAVCSDTLIDSMFA